ncbi:MAG TPA: nuclear transport factor 2 family protein [Verrucomicrobiae bacterium]|nr:nuclear transport factor 2 family protein [Verrucomicrobiae bacterium]
MGDLTEIEIRNAEAACHALCVDYCEIVDSQEYSRLRDIFTPDVIFARPTAPQDPLRGVETVVASFEARLRTRVTQHFVTNIRVRVESATAASGSCRILLYMAEASEPETSEGRQAAPKQLVGVYRDRFVRTEDGWRFAERSGKTLFHT